MADLFKKIEELSDETGLVFGFPGNPYLQVAVERASKGRPNVVVLTAANPASVRALKTPGLLIAEVENSQQFNDKIVPALKLLVQSKQLDAIVFHGLAEYAQKVLLVITKQAPQQAEWGEMSRAVTNDLRLLTAICPVLYVTCDVATGEDAKKNPVTDLNINPGLKKSILGDLAYKLYVVDNATGGDPIVQENPAKALAFQRGLPPAAVPGTNAQASVNVRKLS